MNEWYYTRDGKQQGPISREAIGELARNGGLDPLKDLVWTSTMKDWLPAGQIPDLFTAVAKSDLSAAQPAPHLPSGSPVREIEAGSQPLSQTACIKRAFDVVMRHFGMILLVGLLFIASSALVSALLAGMDSALGLPPANPAETVQVGARVEVALSDKDAQASHLHILLSNVFAIFLSLGLTRIGLNLVSGKPVTPAMVFGGGRQLVTACLATILYTAMLIVGLILFIVPGIYLALRFGFYLHAIVDRNLGVLDSLKYSSTLTTHNRLRLFGLAVLTACILIAGTLALLVGLVIAIPIAWLTWVVAYRWLQYGYTAALDQPGSKTPMLAANP